MKTILLVTFLFVSGCGGFVEYTIITAGTLSGRIAHDVYQDYNDDKESDNKDDSKKETKKGN